ncbi:MAG: recombinase zinc beta ribbon domain-containing protein [Actinomycetota bacterium]
MAPRIKNEGRTYVRRSTTRQETGIHEQLAWTITEAARLGVRLDAAASDLDYMLTHGMQRHKGIYLDDGISGSDWNRPGFVAFRRDALTNPRISHLFVHLSDRFSRPEQAVQAMQMEIELLLAGLTIVFHNRISEPRERGLHYFEKDILLLYEYTQNGEFLSKLATRIIQTQVHLARDGFRTGGAAPYGFIRVLVDAHGQEVQELPTGTTMRRDGCHVVLKPNDPAKIQTWLYILHLFGERGWGLMRITNHLNDLGIPSPQAHLQRRIHGKLVRASGKWNMRSVARLIDDATIIGINEHGKRCRGKHRRWTPTGPRTLTDADRRDDGEAKLTNNASDAVVATPARFPVDADETLFRKCQAIRKNRRHNQRGIPRCTDPARYPLSTRIHDISPGCGAVLYGRENRKRRLYMCSRYSRSGGRECHHNTIDAEDALGFVLDVLRQRILVCGGNEALRKRLEALASAERRSPAGPMVDELSLLERRLAALEAEAQSIRRNLARAGDEASIFAAIKEEYQTNQSDIGQTRQRIAELQKAQAVFPVLTPKEEVEAAMQLLAETERIAGDANARAEVPQLLRKLDVHLWLRFGEVVKGARTFRNVQSGVLTLGSITHSPASMPDGDTQPSDGADQLSPDTPKLPSFMPCDTNWFTMGAHHKP